MGSEMCIRDRIYIPFDKYVSYVVLRTRSGNAVLRATPPLLLCGGVTSEYNPIYSWIIMPFALRQYRPYCGPIAIENIFEVSSSGTSTFIKRSAPRTFPYCCMSGTPPPIFSGGVTSKYSQVYSWSIAPFTLRPLSSLLWSSQSWHTVFADLRPKIYVEA